MRRVRKQQAVTSETIDPGAKDLVRRVFGRELGDKMALAAGYGKRKDYRSVLEPTDAVAQCVRAGVPFVPGMECYLCGILIPPKETLSGPEDELYVECEHILPVTEGRWYLDLYMSTRRPDDEWTTRAIQLEYAQAHRVCNQAKSNMSFVSADGANLVPDDGKIRAILVAIQRRADGDLRSGYGEYQKNNKKLMESIRGMNIDARVAAIRPRIKAIADHIYTDPPLESLTLLARTAMLVDPTPLSPAVLAAYEKDTGLTLEEREAEAKRRLEKFRNKAYDEYPMFREKTLRANMLRLIPDLASVDDNKYADILSDAGVNAVLDTYYNKAPSLDLSDPPRVTAIVYYGLYLHLFERMVTVSPEPTALLCTLHARMTGIARINKIIPDVFGPVPDMSEGLRTRCANLRRDERLEERGRVDESAAPATPEELANYYLGGDFESTLIALFNQAGVPYPEHTAERLATRARANFAEAIRNGASVRETLNTIASDMNTAIRIWYESFPGVDNLAANVSMAILGTRAEHEPSDYVPLEISSEPVGAGAGAGSGASTSDKMDETPYGGIGKRRTGGKRSTRRPLYG